MAKKQREEPSGDSWMNTYSDLVTLLMTFFVLLFSMSSVDAEKWELLVDALAGDKNQVVIDPDGTSGSETIAGNQGEQSGEMSVTGNPEDLEEFDDLFAFLQKYVEENNLTESIEVMKDGSSVVYIRFRNNIFFMPDKADLRPEALEILGYLGDCLGAVEDQIYVISINGHTAQVDTLGGVYSVSDWLLSGERASQVARYLDEEKKILLAQMDNDPKMASKPAQVKEKIVTGKLNKFYAENCLLQQSFVKDGEVTVEQYVEAASKKLGGAVTLKDAVRFEKGEGIEKKQENFAEEIAKLAK